MSSMSNNNRQNLDLFPGKLERDRATDARRRARHQRSLPFEVVSSHG